MGHADTAKITAGFQVQNLMNAMYVDEKCLYNDIILKAALHCIAI